MGRPSNCGKCSKPKRPKSKAYKGKPGYCECGRPTKMHDETLKKLKEAFSYGMSDVKSCAYAGITVQTLWNHQQDNPKFFEEKQRLKELPSIKAHQTVVGVLNDPQHAWRYLEKKDDEFKPAAKIEHTIKEETIDDVGEMTEQELQALEVIRQGRRDRIKNKTRQEYAKSISGPKGTKGNTNTG